MLDYQFESIHHTDYLHVKVEGLHDTAEVTYDYMLRMIKSARAQNTHVIFIEEDFPDHPGVLEAYQNFTQLISHLRDFTIIFYDHQSAQFERNKLLEYAVKDLGANYIVCKSKEDALKRLSHMTSRL